MSWNKVTTQCVLFCRESKSLRKGSRLEKIEVQLSDVNEYAITNPQSQRVVVKGSVREKLAPGLTIKSSHIRIGEPIGQGNLVNLKYY